MNYRDIILTANGNLRKSKLRTFLTISAIFIGAFTLMMTSGVGYGLRSYVDQQVAGVGAEDALFITMARSQENPLSSDVKEYDPNKKADLSFGQLQALQPMDLNRIKETEHIKSIQPMYSVEPLYITAGQKKYVTTLSQALDGINQAMLSGRMVNEKAREYEVTLPPSYVNGLGFANEQDAVGKKVTFAFKNATGEQFAKDATVVGVQQKSLLNANAMSGNTAFVEDAFNKSTAGLPTFQKDRYLYAHAKFDTSISDVQLKDLKTKLKTMGYDAQTLDDQLGLIKNVINGITSFLTIFAGIALLAATFGIVNTLLMAVQERTREIGLMKALGMSRHKIFTLFSIEAILLGFWGSLAALIAANIIGPIANSAASKTIFKDFDGLHLLSFPAVQMIMIMLLIMAISFIAATLPARRASRLDPIEALRYE
ncbi:MAG: putative permease [Candidatus Saccharibacteria bacterium]|nr:putative permease [Candidatus Saccharibacteria bacterium]